jgi:PASTA domain
VPDRWVNPQGWGQQPEPPPPNQPPTQPAGWGPPPPPDRPPNSNPLWRRKGFWVVAGSVGALLLLAGLLPDSNRAATKAAATSATAAPATSAPPPPSTSTPPPPTTATPPTTVAKAAVPNLVGMAAGQAKTALSRRGLRWTVTYKATGRFAPGTVISQSSKAGEGVLLGTVVALVVAKAPPPATTAPRNCDPAYPDVCLHDGIGDYDCAGGTGNGPNYVRGPIRVLPPDPFDLDRDGDGTGCDSG